MRDMPSAARINMGEVGPVPREGLNALGRKRFVAPGIMNELTASFMCFSPRQLNSFIFGQVVKLISH